MKRGADNQLTKDSPSDDEIEEVPGGSEGFRKADNSVLASRPMRKLPKRSLAGTPSPAPSTAPLPDAPPVPATKFSGFTGFSTSSNSFTFTPPVSTISNTNTTSSLFGPSLSSLPTNSPAVTPTASNTAKTFASLLGEQSSKSDATPQKNGSASPNEPPEVDDPAALKYYTSLRGLNVSFLATLSKATEEDPFRDVTELLEQYKSLRLNVQKEFDERNKTPSKPPTILPKSASMPKPPTQFTGFGLPSTSTPTASESSSGGFTPKATTSTSTSAFSFPPAPAPAPAATTSAFSFAAPPTAQGTSAANPFTLPPTSSLFGTPAKSTPPSTSFTFGTSSSSSTTNAFADAKLPSTNLFGAPNAFNTSTAPAAPSKTTPFGGFGSFGKPTGTAGSIGNPVGFGFGSPSRTPESGAVTPGSSIPSESGGKSEDGDNDKEGNGEEEAKADVASPSLLANNPHDEEGEGEEQEDTVYAVKLKAFRLRKAEEKGEPGWVELGYGVLRVKKHKETEARRLLLRNSHTGKIKINFNLYSGLNPTQNKKTLTFVGHDAGVSQTYSVRLQGEEQAKALRDVLDREISFVKAKASD